MDTFRPTHFIFIILGASIVSLKTYPRVFLINGQRDSWIAIVISSVLIFFFFLYIVNIWKKSGEKNLVKLYQSAVGEVLGNILIALFTITLFITLIECASVEADSMHQNMLVEVPKWYFLLFFVLPSIYVVRKNIVAIIAINIIGIILIMLAGMNLGILTAKYKEVSMLFPVFENGITLGFIKAILETLGLYGCISIALPYLSKLEDSKGTIIRNVIIALIILIQMEIVSTSGILMTFTPFRASSMNYPKLLQTQLVSYNQYFDFGELYVMLQIVGGWLIKYLLSFYGILTIFRNYSMNRNHMKYAVYIMSIVVYFASYFASKDSLILFELLNYYQYVCLINFVFIPFIVFTAINVKIRLHVLPKDDDLNNKKTNT